MPLLAALLVSSSRAPSAPPTAQPAPAAAPRASAPRSSATAQNQTASPRGPVRPPATGPAASRPSATRPDAELERDIRARFARSKIAVENFRVRVQDGVATIEGRTSVIQRKGTATRLARLAGAREVHNRVEISDAAREKAAKNLATGRRRLQVKRGEPHLPNAGR